MPSPIGHAIAGAAIAWVAEAGGPPPPTRRPWTLTVLCAGLAAAPDLDLLAPYQHRTATHSILALALVVIIAMVVTGKVRGRVISTIVWAAGAAYASHLLLDWLAEDSTPPRGLQLLWPFSGRWFISDLDLFRGTARLHIFTANSMRINALAIAQEIAILGPLAAVAWLVRVKALARFPAELSGRHHPAQ